MRDDYDDKFKQLDFSCSMVLSMKKIFFGTGVNKIVEDKIIRHLLTCKECRRIYTEYAREIGYKKFNLITYAIQFCEGNKDYLDSETRRYLEEVRDNKPLRVLARPYTHAVEVFDINKLMQLKFFRDLCNEYNSPGQLDYSGFMKYIAKKWAKYVDHLEECLLKEAYEKPE